VIRRLALLALLPFLLVAAREPVLVPEVSQDEINIQYGFTGAQLLLFGAVVYPGNDDGEGTDIVVVVKGPVQSIVLREKQKVAGIWVNAESAEFRSAPAFFSVASSRPLDQIVDAKTAAIYELGLDYLQLSPTDAINPDEQARFIAGLVDLNQRHNLYNEKPGSVEINENVLYQARIHMPASVPTGTYTAETFLIRDGKVLAAADRRITIRKYGFEKFVATAAEYQPFFYGLVAVLISLGLGWGAGVAFRRA
jgi:uncharacterized protein (TIGR02186 family)